MNTKQSISMSSFTMMLLVLILLGTNSYAQFPLEKPEHVTDKQWQGLSTALIDAKILPEIEPGKNFLGSSVAIYGTDAAIGIWGDDQRGIDAGAVYYFVEDNEVWTIRDKLTLDDGHNGDRFGSSIAISNDYLVVGAWGDGENGSFAGAVYAYSFFNSENSHYLNLNISPLKITASDANSLQRFGYSLDLVDDQLLVGAWGDDDNGVEAGAAYVIDIINNSSWSEEAKLTAPDGNPNDRLGYTVAVNTDKALVGAYQNNENGANSGAAYFYNYDGLDWNIAGKIDPPDGAAGDHFAFALDMTEDFAIIGSPNDDGIESNAGSAYIYTIDTGATLAQKITAADGMIDDKFGSSVSLSGTELIIGSPFADSVLFVDTGAAYLYSYDGLDWGFDEKIVDPTSDVNAQFGLAVTVDNNRSLTGSPHQTVLFESDAGSASFHRTDGLTWNFDTEISASVFHQEGNFGQTLVIDGNHALIGMPKYNEGIQIGGAVYAYEYIDRHWMLTQVIVPENINDSGGFGTAIDIKGNTAVITARNADSDANNTGAVYVYEYSTQWLLVNKLVPAGLPVNANIGDAVALSSNQTKLAVSDLFADGTMGAVYTFSKFGGSWEEKNKLTADDLSIMNDFGVSLVFDGFDLLVGAAKVHGDVDNGTGAVYVFEYSSSAWSQVDKLFASSQIGSLGFGRDISLSGNRLLVGTASGWPRSYVFDKKQFIWQQTAEITLGGYQSGQSFGYQVALEGDNALIGDPENDDVNDDQGMIYWYQYDGSDWNLIREFYAADGQAEDKISTQMALNDNRVLISAPYQDEQGADVGAVYIFNLDVIFVDGFNQPQ